MQIMSRYFAWWLYNRPFGRVKNQIISTIKYEFRKNEITPRRIIGFWSVVYLFFIFWKNKKPHWTPCYESLFRIKINTHFWLLQLIKIEYLFKTGVKFFTLSNFRKVGEISPVRQVFLLKAHRVRHSLYKY